MGGEIYASSNFMMTTGLDVLSSGMTYVKFQKSKSLHVTISQKGHTARTGDA